MALPAAPASRPHPTSPLLLPGSWELPPSWSPCPTSTTIPLQLGQVTPEGTFSATAQKERICCRRQAQDIHPRPAFSSPTGHCSCLTRARAHQPRSPRAAFPHGVGGTGPWPAPSRPPLGRPALFSDVPGAPVGVDPVLPPPVALLQSRCLRKAFLQGPGLLRAPLLELPCPAQHPQAIPVEVRPSPPPD